MLSQLLSSSIHVLAGAPLFEKSWKGTSCDCNPKAKYQQYTCRAFGCTQKVHTYCTCSVGHYMCKSCHITHPVEEVTNENSINQIQFSPLLAFCYFSKVFFWDFPSLKNPWTFSYFLIVFILIKCFVKSLFGVLFSEL